MGGLDRTRLTPSPTLTILWNHSCKSIELFELVFRQADLRSLRRVILAGVPFLLRKSTPVQRNAPPVPLEPQPGRRRDAGLLVYSGPRPAAGSTSAPSAVRSVVASRTQVRMRSWIDIPAVGHASTPPPCASSPPRLPRSPVTPNRSCSTSDSRSSEDLRFAT